MTSLEDFKGNINVELRNKSGTYHILNLVNKKLYIGSTNNLYKRMYEHYRNLIQNKHPNKHLQNAWNKYGEDNFRFFVNGINEDVSTLINDEQFRIDLFVKHRPDLLYNINLTAGSVLGFKHSNDTKKKLSENHLGKKPSEETRKKMSITRRAQLHGAKLTEQDVINIKLQIRANISIRKISEKYNIDVSQIYRIKKGEQWGWVEIPNDYLNEQVGDLYN
jgi:group I intron endonuclease